MKEELAYKQGRRWRIRILKSEFTLLRFKIHRSANFLLLLLFFYVIEFDNCWELNSKGLFLSLKKEFFWQIVSFVRFLQKT